MPGAVRVAGGRPGTLENAAIAGEVDAQEA